nr:MAG TPA: hypothetical protein [Caudoviricetes sp.]
MEICLSDGQRSPRFVYYKFCLKEDFNGKVKSNFFLRKTFGGFKKSRTFAALES